MMYHELFSQWLLLLTTTTVYKNPLVSSVTQAVDTSRFTSERYQAAAVAGHIDQSLLLLLSLLLQCASACMH
jgi:hypothetical protein